MQVITNEIKEFVNKQKLGFAATVCPDGTPNLSPKGTTIAWDNEHLEFADIHSHETINNLITNPAIEVNVVDIFTRKGYRFKGTAKVLSEGWVFEEIISFYRSLGSKHKINNIAFIKVERIMPLMSPVYDTNVTEAEIKNRWIEYWDGIHKKIQVK